MGFVRRGGDACFGVLFLEEGRGSRDSVGGTAFWIFNDEWWIVIMGFG